MCGLVLPSSRSIYWTDVHGASPAGDNQDAEALEHLHHKERLRQPVVQSEEVQFSHVFNYLMSEGRAAYRKNRAGLNSELHTKKKFKKTQNNNLQAMDISCEKWNINQTNRKIYMMTWSKTGAVPGRAVKSAFSEMFKA